MEKSQDVVRDPLPLSQPSHKPLPWTHHFMFQGLHCLISQVQRWNEITSKVFQP
jgi:hypothetical protein